MIRSITSSMQPLVSGPWILAILGCGQPVLHPSDNTEIIQAKRDTCDDPDANINCCFVNAPDDLNSTMTIAEPDESGDQLIISGTFYKEDGETPYPNLLIYAYHTDAKGFYPKRGTEKGAQRWQGYLHGWCKTDKDGRYEIRTIRPAPYPDNSLPAHIHVAVKPEDREALWINDHVFKDDELVNETYLSSLVEVGGTGVIELSRTQNGVWIGKRDVVLR